MSNDIACGTTSFQVPSDLMRHFDIHFIFSSQNNSKLSVMKGFPFLKLRRCNRSDKHCQVCYCASQSGNLNQFDIWYRKRKIFL